MSEKENSPEVQLNNELDCNGCGAVLKFKPGTHHLRCEYCGAENEIYNPEENELKIEESSLEEYFRTGLDKEEKMEVSAIQCKSCGGSFSFEPTVSSGFCPFCGSSVVLDGGTVATVYKPKYLLPFHIDKKTAFTNFQKWLKSLWFAPKALVSYGNNPDNFKGLYIPFWTYDCNTTTEYEGKRGDNYTDTIRVNVVENGRNVTKTRHVTKTRWSHRSGTVYDQFDDVMIMASHAISRSRMQKIKQWNLNDLVPFNDKYLSGFQTESYSLKIEEGYEYAKEVMQQQINYSIRRDIGGDRQQINHTNVKYADMTFKQILVPVWISSYRFKGKVYQFLINGRTGHISGQRPYSAGKIILAVLGVAAVIAIIALFS